MTFVDARAARFGQGATALLAGLALALQSVPLLAAAAAPLALGAFAGWNPWTRLFRALVRSPPSRTKPAAPLRFANGVGAAVLGAALVAVLAGLALAGWALAGLVVALALLAAAADVCVGCEAYELARRAGLVAAG